MIIRVRSKVGTWRHKAEPDTKLSEFLANVEHEKGAKITKVALQPSLAEPLQEAHRAKTLGELGLKHGDMLYVEASGGTAPAGLVGAAGARAIDSHGNVVAANKADGEGFRPGLQSLRTQKLHWTLTDMVEFDSKYTFEVKGEQLSFCSSASLDAGACNNFQLYLQNFGFNTSRCAFLYGTFEKAKEIEGSVEHKAAAEARGATGAAAGASAASAGSGPPKRKMDLKDLESMVKDDTAPKRGVKVEAVYEPLQRCENGVFELLEDPREEKVDTVAKALGLQRVGFMVAHPPRENYHFSTHEILAAAEHALEATDGQFDSPFVVVKVTSEGGNASFDAYSLTPQCLEMVAEDALVVMPENPGHSAVNETFTLIVEKKEAHVVDNDFFIKRVPIISHTSPFTGNFPRFNRDHDQPPSNEALRRALAGLGASPSDEALARALADFNLLVYLGEVFDTEDGLADIAAFVASHVRAGAEPRAMQEGYKVLLFSLAGLE